MVNTSYKTEICLLATIISKPDILDNVMDIIDVDTFTADESKNIYRWIKECAKDGTSITPVKLMMFIRDKMPSQSESFVNSLQEGFYEREEVDDVVKYLTGLKGRRQVAAAANTIIDMTNDMDIEIDNIISQSQDLIFSCSGNASAKPFYTMEDIIMSAYQQMVERSEGKRTGVSTGYPSLDSFLGGGLKEGHLTVVAGATSMGKTNFAINIVKNILMKEDAPTFFVSMEMTHKEVADRFLIQESLVGAKQYYKVGIRDEFVFNNISAAMDRIYEKNLLCSDDRGLTVEDIKAKSRRANSEFGGSLKLIVVDYLQHMNIPPVHGSMVQGFGNAVTELKNLAGELNATVILLSQINRGVTSRPEKEPALSDLRGSGEIEEKADEIIFVYRPEYYKKKEEHTKIDDDPEDAKIIVAKSRTSRTGKTEFKWYPEYLYFNDNYFEERYGPMGQFKEVENEDPYF